MINHQSGRTTQQMREASHGAVFVWCNENIYYPVRLTYTINRRDIQVVPRSWFRVDRLAGKRFTEIVLDHAIRLTKEEYEMIDRFVVPNSFE
jgi:hypothetical protein